MSTDHIVEQQNQPRQLRTRPTVANLTPRKVSICIKMDGKTFGFASLSPPVQRAACVSAAFLEPTMLNTILEEDEPDLLPSKHHDNFLTFVSDDEDEDEDLFSRSYTSSTPSSPTSSIYMCDTFYSSSSSDLAISTAQPSSAPSLTPSPVDYALRASETMTRLRQKLSHLLLPVPTPPHTSTLTPTPTPTPPNAPTLPEIESYLHRGRSILNVYESKQQRSHVLLPPSHLLKLSQLPYCPRQLRPFLLLLLEQKQSSTPIVDHLLLRPSSPMLPLTSLLPPLS